MHNFEQIFTENRPLPNFGEMFTRITAQRGRGSLNPYCNDPEKPERSYMHAAAESKGE